MDFDLEELVNVEQTFYEHGYTDGHAHGRVHGLIEGRALGREKGFEMWEELGFYEGFARMWGALLLPARGTDERAQNHIRHLLELVARFPRVNPSAAAGPGSASDADPDVDIPRLFRQIRSRYKLLCATLGVRPSLRAADDPSPSRADGAAGTRSPGQGHDDRRGGRGGGGGGGGEGMNVDVGVDVGVDVDVGVEIDAEPSASATATGRVALRTERKKGTATKAAVWAVHDPRAGSTARTPGGGGGAGLSF